MKHIHAFILTGALVIGFGFVAEANKKQVNFVKCFDTSLLPEPIFNPENPPLTPPRRGRGKDCKIDKLYLTETTENYANDILAEKLTTHYLNKTPVDDFPANLTLEEAREIQSNFIESLKPSLGETVGYKAGLTSEAAQSKFKVDHPLKGVLLREMLLETNLENKAVVAANFGAIPMVEGDLMVRVGSEAINTAKTPLEVLAALDAVIPFIELPDLIYGENVTLNAPNLLAINVGARLGVMGKPIPLEATSRWLKKLVNIQVILLDESGNQLAVGESNALLGHPLNVVLWLRDSLKAEGMLLTKGDLISLGTITPLMPVTPGATIRAQYLGLNSKDSNESVEVSVTFKE